MTRHVHLDPVQALRPKRLSIVIVMLVCVALASLLFIAAVNNGNEKRAEKRACHALGDEYHYWSERQQCVRYVEIP